MTDEETARKGRRAYDEYAELKGVFDKLEQGAFQALLATPIGNDAKVLNIHKTLDVARRVSEALRLMIDNGKMAESALEIAGLLKAD